MSPAAAAGGYVLAISIVTFWAFAADKRRAVRGGQRVPERTLLMLAAIGGTPGAFAGQAVLRHKSRKQPLGALLWLIAAIQVLAGLAAWLAAA